MKDKMFSFRDSWMNVLTALPDEVRLEVYDAVMEYGLSGRLSDLKPMARVAFGQIRADIDKEKEKRRHISEVRRKSVCKRYKSIQMYTNVESPQETAIPPASADGSSRAHDIGNQKDNIDAIKNINQEKIEREWRERQKEAEAFIDHFNRRMLDAKAVIPHQCRYTPRRRDNINARKREFGRDALYEMVDKAAASDFLNGKNQRGFVATLDWLLRPNNFPKVIEGNYDNDRVNRINSNTNSYGNNENYDPRRGVEAGYHSPEEYE